MSRRCSELREELSQQADLPVCTEAAPTNVLGPFQPAKKRNRLGISFLKQIFSVQISDSGVVNPLVMGLEWITALRVEPDQYVIGVWIQLSSKKCGLPKSLWSAAGAMAPPHGHDGLHPEGFPSVTLHQLLKPCVCWGRNSTVAAAGCLLLQRACRSVGLTSADPVDSVNYGPQGLPGRQQELAFLNPRASKSFHS